MPKSLTDRTLTRRSLVGGSAVTAALLAGATLPSEFGRAVIAQDGAKEFHAAWPYTEPPNGHFNVFVVDGILANPNVYGDMIWQPFGLFNWGSQ
ncbi:MAG: hypothetical protein ACR2OE_19350 [Thermomicrobiales bacterium]